MFDLEKAINDWRQQLMVSEINSRQIIDELESHLREDVALRMRTGLSADEAFTAALERLGKSGVINDEFVKVKHHRVRPGGPVLRSTLLMFAVTLVAAGLVALRALQGGPLLWVHVVTVTAGYSCMLLVGGVAVYLTGVRWFARSRSEHTINDAFTYGYSFSAALIGVALLSGSVWSRETLGRAWGGSPREIGALLVLAWAAGTIVLRRIWGFRDYTLILICIGGNIIISLAWFGAAILARGGRGYGSGNHWIFEFFIAAHTLILIVGALSPRPVRLNLA